MNLVKAEAKDFKRIREHYECIIDNTEDIEENDNLLSILQSIKG